jgi:translation elongation factor P/translation initiation factor 5A
MIGIGNRIEIQGELYEIIRAIKVGMGKVLPTDFVNELKEYWHAEKTYKQGDVYYFVNEIETIEPIKDEQDRNTGEATVDSPENTTGR